jgi:hypothetical protein
MNSCPPHGSYSVCERVTVGGAGYTYVRGQVADKIETSAVKPYDRLKVEALGKDTPSILLNLEVRLRRLQEKGIPYSTINRYFRAALNDDQIGLFNLKEMLTYGRGEPEKGYSDAFTALSQIPSSINMSWLYSIVDGMPE